MTMRIVVDAGPVIRWLQVVNLHWKDSISTFEEVDGVKYLKGKDRICSDLQFRPVNVVLGLAM